MLLFAIALVAGTLDNGAFELSCYGGGGARHVESSSLDASDSEGRSFSGTINHSSTEAFEDQVDVRIDGQDSRIRLPRMMLPILKGGDRGWFKLKNMIAGSDTITGSASVNPINNPKVIIDRRTGVITIAGKSGHYTGQCKLREPADETRRF